MRKRTLRILYFIFWFLFIFMNLLQSSDVILQKQKELQEKRQKINALKEQVKVLESKELSILREINNIDYQLDKTERELSNAEARLGEAQSNLLVLTNQLKIMERNLKNRSLNYKDMLKDVFKENNTHDDIWQVFLGEKSSFDFLAIPYYVRCMFKIEANRLKTIDQQRREIAEKRKEWEEEKKRVENLVEEIEQKKAYIEKMKSEKSAYLEDIRKQKRLQQQTIATLERESKEIEALIRKLASDKVAKAKKGNLSWPVIGSITSGFGMRRHPLLGGAPMFHTGIDISASYGTPVKAVAPGRVIFAGWYGGYGKLVILDHGGGISTLYAHLSRIVVNLEEQVSEGEVIGYVGSTGLSTGPHLHFEVRVNGEPKDPTLWLK